MGLIEECPNTDTIEVSIIGTGGGYGECIVVHLGNDEWIVIDSCKDPITKKCLPLEYLENKNIDIAHSVKLIICTHWHDDHILGISDLYAKCKSALFCMSSTSDRLKFLQLVQLDYHKIKDEACASSTLEIAKCIEITNNRKKPIKEASQDKLLFTSTITDRIKANIYSLSPSDFVVDQFRYELSTLLEDFKNSNRKIVCQSPNDKSVVLLITIGDHSILLGSDLEVNTENEKKGWIAILNDCNCIKDKKASLIKIPHHGSSNGYSPRIWDELLDENPVAGLTPWNRNAKLPKQEMVDVFFTHTNQLFITSPILTDKISPKKREYQIEKAIQKFNKTVREIRYAHGVVRCRINLEETSWEIDLFGKAIQLNMN